LRGVNSVTQNERVIAQKPFSVGKQYPPTTRPPKYRNPADPEETWHGRGPWPEWLKDLEKAGRKREEFLIGA
jgi:DNA-binding protein H-NS